MRQFVLIGRLKILETLSIYEFRVTKDLAKMQKLQQIVQKTLNVRKNLTKMEKLINFAYYPPYEVNKNSSVVLPDIIEIIIIIYIQL